MTQHLVLNKESIKPLRAALHDFDADRLRRALDSSLTHDAQIHLGSPLGFCQGPAEFYATAFEPLSNAMPDLERRDFIVIAGQTDTGDNWVGCAGHYLGTFISPWLGIPPTGHVAHLRFHEFYRIVHGKVAEVQAIWDIPELMMQAGVWPMVPGLGREMMTPAPASQDGIDPQLADRKAGASSLELVLDMLTHLSKHPGEGGPEVMQMERFWHPKMMWYGPAGIGSTRGIEGFRKWHQIPFLKAMPDRGQHSEGTECHFFAEGNYVGVTGWPNMKQTLSRDGWLGLPPTGQVLTLRSLDFWRIEAGKIRENWVLVDLLDVYAQLGIDVFDRLQSLVDARPSRSAASQGGS